MDSVADFFAELYGGSLYSILVVDEKQKIIYATREIIDLVSILGEQDLEVFLTPSVQSEISYCLDRMKNRVVPIRIGDHLMEVSILPYPYQEHVYLVLQVERRPTPLADEEVQLIFRNTYGKLTSYLSDIYGMTQKIGLDTPEGEDIGRNVRRILRMAHHLYHSMDSAGKMHYRVPMEMNSFTRIFVKNFLDIEPTAELHYIPGEDGLYAKIMPENLEIVLGTLVCNGLRFGKERVLVYAHREGEKIYITVSDDGDGVENPERLFELGYRTFDKYGIKGMGYSLCMAKRMLETQGAELFYERKGGETCFHVAVDAIHLPEGRLAEWRPEPLENTLSQFRIEISDFVKETEL